MSRHTPGPWTARKRVVLGPTQEDGRAVIIALARGRNDDGTRSEDVPNARLMAAAPDLLAASKKALNVLRVLAPTEPDADAPIEGLREAIAKAERQDPDPDEPKPEPALSCRAWCEAHAQNCGRSCTEAEDGHLHTCFMVRKNPDGGRPIILIHYYGPGRRETYSSNLRGGKLYPSGDRIPKKDAEKILRETEAV